MLESRGLVQHIVDATHAKGHTLDLLITRPSDQVISGVRVSEDLVSDHNLVHFGINLSRPPNDQTIYTLRRIVNSTLLINCADFSIRLRSIFPDFQAGVGPDGLYNFYNESVTSILDEVAPLVTKSVIEKPRATWCSDNSDERTAMTEENGPTLT